MGDFRDDLKMGVMNKSIVIFTKILKLMLITSHRFLYGKLSVGQK